MASTILDLPVNTWTKVLTDVTYNGQVHVIDLDTEPTMYLIALVDTGGSAPAADFAGGIKFDEDFAPTNSTASDYYVKALDNAGKVVILT